MLSGCSYGILEYNFTNGVYMEEMTNLRIADAQDCIILSTGAERPSFLYPYGKCSGIELWRELWRIAAKNGIVPEASQRNAMHEEGAWRGISGQMEIYIKPPTREINIYETESLMTLKGKKLSSKRNSHKPF